MSSSDDQISRTEALQRLVVLIPFIDPLIALARVAEPVVRFFRTAPGRLLEDPREFIVTTIGRFVVGVIIGGALSVAGVIGDVFGVFIGAIDTAISAVLAPFGIVGGSVITAFATINQSIANQIGPALGIGAFPIVVVLVVLEVFGILRLSAPVLRVLASAVETVPVVGPALSTAIVALLELVGLIVDVLPFGGES